MISSPEHNGNVLENQFLLDASNLRRTDPLASRIDLGFVDFMAKPEHATWLMGLRADKLESNEYTPGHNVRHLRYLFHKILLERFPKLRADNFPSIEACTQLLTETYDDSIDRVSFEIDHMIYNPMTTKPGRYYASLLTAKLLLPSSSSFRTIDFGSGNNSGIALMHIASNKLPRRVLGEALPASPKLASRNLQNQQSLNMLLADSVDIPLEQAWGLDISHPFDFTVQQYARVCGPTKLLFDDTHKDMKTTLLSHAVTSRDVLFTRYDTTEPNFFQKPPIEGGVYVVSDGNSYPFTNDPLPEQPVDIVSAMYMLYMHPPEKRQVIFNNMCNLGRIVLVFDAIEAVNNNPVDNPIDQLVFSKEWPDYSTHALAYDQENPELGWQSIARSKEGDFALIKPGKLLINGLQKASQVLTR